MADSKFIPCSADTDPVRVAELAAENLRMQGYEAAVQPMGNSAMLSVARDRTGFKNIIGLGLECTSTISLMNDNTLNISTESEWSNKIIAVAVGWFLCLVPFITGLVGLINQSELPNKISAAVTAAAAVPPNQE